MDWTQCELIECVPGKVSGQPIVRGTRILPDAIVDSFDLGQSIAELHEGFPALSLAQINRLIEFAHQVRRVEGLRHAPKTPTIAIIRARLDQGKTPHP